jgi:hypothetical protein
MIPVENYEAVCRAVPYRVKGVFYSELYLFLQACSDNDVNLVIESGVKHGMSTRLLASAWPGEIISIDRDDGIIPEVVEGVQFMEGDSRELIPMILRAYKGRRAAVLIDGPKGETALQLKAAIWQSDIVRVVAIHDLPLEAVPSCHRHSHEPSFRTSVGRRLDAFIAHDYARKYPNGTGLAIWEKKQ